MLHIHLVPPYLPHSLLPSLPPSLPYSHNTKTTHWMLPNSKDLPLSLPPGWDVVQSSKYGIYYVE